jgi:hypothetical protein
MALRAPIWARDVRLDPINYSRLRDELQLNHREHDSIRRRRKLQERGDQKQGTQDERDVTAVRGSFSLHHFKAWASQARGVIAAQRVLRPASRTGATTRSLCPTPLDAGLLHRFSTPLFTLRLCPTTPTDQVDLTRAQPSQAPGALPLFPPCSRRVFSLTRHERAAHSSCLPIPLELSHVASTRLPIFATSTSSRYAAILARRHVCKLIYHSQPPLLNATYELVEAAGMSCPLPPVHTLLSVS